MKIIPAGITWKRTGRRSWICTIRREPEVIYDLSDMTALSHADMAAMNQYAGLGGLGLLGQSLFGVCPCCGQGQSLARYQASPGILDGILGGGFRG